MERPMARANADAVSWAAVVQLFAPREESMLGEHGGDGSCKPAALRTLPAFRRSDPQLWKRQRQSASLSSMAGCLSCTRALSIS